jgi:hypothetical protein
MVSAQDFERDWWGDCTNTYGEETKQLVYARLMGMRFQDAGGPGPQFDLFGRSVLDLGGGPSSLLLKTVNAGQRTVVDPLEIPKWVYKRYMTAGIKLCRMHAEVFRTDPGIYDEVWIYNTLQHVDDPEQVLWTARKAAPFLRLFEWIDVPAHEGHPHELSQESLDLWIGDVGELWPLDGQGGCKGIAYVYVGPTTT